METQYNHVINMTKLLFPFISCAFVSAAPLALEPFPLESDGVKPWPLGKEAGRALKPGAEILTRMTFPPLTERENEASGSWYGMVGLDLFGSFSQSPGQVTLEVFDPPTNEVIATSTTTVKGPVQRAAWVALASSEQAGEGAARAFDGNPETLWHTHYDAASNPPPHWIGIEFGKALTIPGIRYLPRGAGGSNGAAREYRVEIRKPGGAWETAAEGEIQRPAMADPLEVAFKTPHEIEAFRFVILSSWGNNFGSAAELEIPGQQLPPIEDSLPDGRAWVAISPEMSQKLIGRDVGLRLRNGPDAAVVVGAPHLVRLNDAPNSKLFGRSNGGTGPDKLGAGLLGFDALSEHLQSPLTVISVYPNSPAHKAKLRAGDAILAVAGIPMPENNIAPGWNWFHHGHEAFIGGKTEEALRQGKRALALTVMRDGALSEIEIELKRQSPFTTLNPADDPVAAAMLADTLALLVKTQRDDGSWANDIIRTTFSALALMASGETKYRGRVQRAVNWAMKRYPKPEDYGGLGFWAGSYAGILYAEYHLANGNRAVLPHMVALRDWAVAGQQTSIWDVPALGHGHGGLPYGNKALVAPACHLLVFEALAKRCGQQSEIWELLMPFMEMAWSDPAEGGHGSLGYNRSYKDREEFWSRSGLFAMASHLRNERTDMRDAMIGFMKENHPWLRNSHAYGEPGGGLGLLALNLVQPESYLKTIRQYDWWFSLAWEPGYGLRFTQPHMGAPYMGEDDLINAVYALVLQAPRRSLHLTGMTK